MSASRGHEKLRLSIMWINRAAGQHLLIILVFGLVDAKCVWMSVSQHGWRKGPKKLHVAV